MTDYTAWRCSLTEYCEYLRREGNRVIRRLRDAETKEEEKAIFKKFQNWRDRLRQAEEQLLTER